MILRMRRLQWIGRARTTALLQSCWLRMVRRTFLWGSLCLSSWRMRYNPLLLSTKQLFVHQKQPIMQPLHVDACRRGPSCAQTASY